MKKLPAPAQNLQGVGDSAFSSWMKKYKLDRRSVESHPFYNYRMRDGGLNWAAIGKLALAVALLYGTFYLIDNSFKPDPRQGTFQATVQAYRATSVPIIQGTPIPTVQFLH